MLNALKPTGFGVIGELSIHGSMRAAEIYACLPLDLSCLPFGVSLLFLLP